MMHGNGRNDFNSRLLLHESVCFWETEQHSLQKSWHWDIWGGSPRLHRQDPPRFVWAPQTNCFHHLKERKSVISLLVRVQYWRTNLVILVELNWWNEAKFSPNHPWWNQLHFRYLLSHRMNQDCWWTNPDHGLDVAVAICLFSSQQTQIHRQHQPGILGSRP